MYDNDRECEDCYRELTEANERAEWLEEKYRELVEVYAKFRDDEGRGNYEVTKRNWLKLIS